MKFLPLVWSNLKRKKLRTLLTLMSILVAFLLYGYLSAVKKAFQAGVDVTGADRLIVRPVPGPQVDPQLLGRLLARYGEYLGSGVAEKLVCIHQRTPPGRALYCDSARCNG